MATNLKLVLRTYSALRQMSPDDVALLETLRNFNDSEREAFVEALSDKPAVKKASKKSSKSSSSKSPRATGIEQQLSKRREQGRLVTTKDDDYDGGDQCQDCQWSLDHNIHHKRSDENYHPFRGVSAASIAPARSPANGGAGSGAANSEIAKDAASNVHHAGG